LCLLAANAFAVTRIERLVNGASYAPAGLPGSDIARGSIFVVQGEDLGPADLQVAGYPLSASFGGTAIRVSAGGTEVSAFILYTSARQVAAILPSNTPLGNAVARISYRDQTSAPFSFTVAQSSPGLFTLNSAGSGPAVLTNPSFDVLTWTNAVREGEAAIGWATGVSPITGPDNVQPPVFDPPVNVEVIVGGKRANVIYKGRAPCCAGLDQIVFTIPEGVRGCNVSLVVRVGSNISNFTTIPVAGPQSRVCSDPNGFRESDLTGIPAGGVRQGDVSLIRSSVRLTLPIVGSIESKSDSAAADFERFDRSFFERTQGLGFVSYGSCIVVPNAGNERVPVDPVQGQRLDAGAALTLTGPGGTRMIPKQRSGAYAADLGSSTSGMVSPGLPLPGGNQAAFLEPGTYTVTGPGGADVGPFTARIAIPQPLNWTNRDAISSVPRSRELTLSWTGAGQNDFVFVAGNSTRNSVGATFFCTAPASAGSVTVPPEVLSALPPSEVVEGADTGFLSIGSAPVADVNRFSASGLDLGFITFAQFSGRTARYE
jgi:uncharacterized protein (TIGR03437 family)